MTTAVVGLFQFEIAGVDGDVYVYYLRQASLFAAVFILCSFFFSQATSIGQNFWMTRWAVSDKVLQRFVLHRFVCRCCLER